MYIDVSEYAGKTFWINTNQIIGITVQNPEDLKDLKKNKWVVTIMLTGFAINASFAEKKEALGFINNFIVPPLEV